MKTFFTNIWNFLTQKAFPTIWNWIKSFTFKDWLLITVSVLLLITFIKYRKTSNELRETTTNLTEQINIYTNKAGEAYSAQQLLIAEKDELLKMNNELANEIKNLKDNPLVITKVKTEFRLDTLYMESDTIIQYIDTLKNIRTYDLAWHYNKEQQYFSIAGVTQVESDFSSFQTRIDNLTVNQEMTMDIIDDGNKLEVITKSDNPYINVIGMQSVMIDPRESKTLKKYFKQKRWGIGPQIGVGIDKNLKFTPYIGVGVSYNIFVF